MNNYLEQNIMHYTTKTPVNDNELKAIYDRSKGFIFDLDGTLYLGDKLIDGAVEAVELLRNSGRKVVFVSNKPIARRSSYAEKLTRLGIECDDAEVINSSLVLARYISSRYADSSIYPVAEKPVIDDLTAQNLTITEDPDATDIVVVSWDRGFNYEKLHIAYRAVMNGALLIGTNPDRTCPMPGGDLPDAACMIAAIEACTEKKVDPIVGKPSEIMLNETLKLIDEKAEDCVMVGDRLETDIQMAHNAGLMSLLVLSGVTKAHDLESLQKRPSAIAESVKELTDVCSEG